MLDITLLGLLDLIPTISSFSFRLILLIFGYLIWSPVVSDEERKKENFMLVLFVIYLRKNIQIEYFFFYNLKLSNTMYGTSNVIKS